MCILLVKLCMIIVQIETSFLSTDFLTGQPQKLSDVEYIYERTFAELKYFIHI